MFLADDVVLFPFKALLKVFQEIHKAAVEEVANEAQAIRNELASLYQLLERGELTEDEFDDRERGLLDRLDAVEEAKGAIEIDPDAGDDDEDDDSDEYPGPGGDDDAEGGDDEGDDEEDEDDGGDGGGGYVYLPPGAGGGDEDPDEDQGPA